MRKKAFGYDEGSWLGVPLRGGGFGMCLAARSNTNGRMLLGYLFGPKLKRLPPLSDLCGLEPKDSVACVRAGALGVMDGEWLVIGKALDWDRAKWKMPQFARRDPITGLAWRVTYSDVDPSKLLREELLAVDDPKLDSDVLFGSGAVEILLTKLLEEQRRSSL